MNKDKTKAAYILWILILLVEIIWFSLKKEILSTGGIMFIVTVILVTLSVGSVGLKIYGNTKEN